MTKGELIELLDCLPDNAEVQVAVQPNYPFLNSLQCVTVKVDAETAEPVGAVLAASDNEEYTTKDWWEGGEVAVDANGEPIIYEED